jgi:hypothetical protein
MNLGSKYYGCKISNVPPPNILSVGNPGHVRCIGPCCLSWVGGGVQIIKAAKYQTSLPNILRVGIQHKGCDIQTPVVCHGWEERVQNITAVKY